MAQVMEGSDFVIRLGVHGTKHSGTSYARDRPQSARVATKPLSSGRARSRPPATVEKDIDIQQVPMREAGDWLHIDSSAGSPGNLESCTAMKLEDIFDKSGAEPLRADKTGVEVPKLVLGGAPVSREPLAAREASSRQAEADRITVKTALSKFENLEFANGAQKWQTVPEIAFHGDRAGSLQANILPDSSSDKEPPIAEVAAYLGARLDPVHAISNPDKYQNVKVHAGHAMSVPEELQNLSEMAHALAHGDTLKAQVAQAANVTGIIGVRRPGYNPMLRKYEQRLPKAVALYLDRGRGAISDYPTEEDGTRRQTQRFAAKETGGDPRQPGEEDDLPKPKLRPSIERLAKPTPKRSGRNEPSEFSWHLPDHLRLPHKERDFQTENSRGLWRFNRRYHEAEIKQRVSQHMSRVKLAHATMQIRANTSREQFMQKQRGREEMLEQMKRAKEITLERQGYQRIWLKHLLVYRAGQIFLHAATHGSDYDASLIANPLQDVRTNMQRLLIRARNMRSTMALRGSKEARKTNTLSLIRWVFENRPLLRGQKIPAIYRWLLRRRYKKQLSHITRAAAVVKDVVIAVGHVKNTLFRMKQWKNEVIKCQRMIRRALIRRDQHLFVILSHVHEYTSLHILKEIMLGVTSIFPPTSAFSARREMSITRHKDVKVHLMRAQEISNYERIFPGLPLWIAISLEKLSAELIKIYGVEYSVNLQSSRVWDTFLKLFKSASLHEEESRELTWKIYNNLWQQSVSQWEEYFRKKVLLDARNEQQRFIVDALCESFGPDAAKYWAEEQARQGTCGGEVKRPVFPIELVQPNKVQDFYKEMYVQARQEQQCHQAAKASSSLARKRDETEALACDADPQEHATLQAMQTKEKVEEAREALLSRQRTKILERVTTKNIMVLVQKEAGPCDEASKSDAAGPTISRNTEEDGDADPIDLRVARSHEYFNIRASTHKAFRALLPALSSKTGPPASPTRGRSSRHEAVGNARTGHPAGAGGHSGGAPRHAASGQGKNINSALGTSGSGSGFGGR